MASPTLAEALRLIETAVAPVATAEIVVDDETSITLRLRERRRGRPSKITLREEFEDHPHHDDEEVETDAARDKEVTLVTRNAGAARVRGMRRMDRAFVDLATGTVRIRAPGLFIDLTGVEIDARPPGMPRRANLDPFADRASLIPRTLVEHPGREWGTREIADEAGVSTMTASHAIRRLEELGVVDLERRGRAHAIRLKSVRTLVHEWTRAYDWRRSTALAVQAPIGSLERFLPRLGQAFGSRQWALTLQAGASRVAPHAAWDTVHMYVDARPSLLTGVASDAGWTPGPGKLVMMSPSYTDSAWLGVRDIDGVRVVSDLQLVLDLWNYPVRGREQAEILLERLENRHRLGRVP